MNKSLQRFLVVISVALPLYMSGCASAPTAATDDINRYTSTKTDDAATTFEPQMVAAMSDDDFWGSGAQYSVDASGRLVYTAQPPVLDDGNYNRLELYEHRTQAGPFYYVDPATGRPIVSPYTYRPRSVRRVPQNPEGVQSPQVSQPVFTPSPRARTPHSETRRAPAPRSSRSTRDDRQ